MNTTTLTIEKSGTKPANARIAVSDRRVFTRTVLDESIMDGENGIKVNKEDGYFRYYYPLSGIIEEFGIVNGPKITFRFDQEAFRRIEKENPLAAAVFYRYNREIFQGEGKSCDMRYIATLCNLDLEKTKQMVCEVERDVLRIVGMGDNRRRQSLI